MTVVITGASGFIARHLTAALLSKGRDVIALTRDAARLEPRPRLCITETDYRSPIDLPSGSTVVHLAALRNAPGRYRREMTQVNVELTRRLGRTAVQRNVAHFIHFGTAIVLGSSRAPLERTELASENATNGDPYIASKIEGIRALEAIEGLPLITLLPSIVYGPDHPHARNRITSHMRRLLSRRWRGAISGASEPRNLVYVDDVVAAIVDAEADATAGRRLVTGENVTQDALERAVFTAAGRTPTPRIVVPPTLLRAAARTADMILRRDQGWTLRIDTLLAPWCFAPSAFHTTLIDGVEATVRSL